jgi:cytochrome c oxidase subunit IV
VSEQEHTEHIVQPGTYVVIIITLLILTGLTVYAATVDLEQFNIVVALAIATLKATLVVLIFMHAKYSPRRTQMVILAAVFWLFILLFMTMSDYVSRIDYRGFRSPMTHIVDTSAIHRA